MTLFIGHTILMTILSIVNGIFTYKIFKSLEMGVDMGKNKKTLNKSKELNGYNSLGTATETFKNPLDGFSVDYGNKKDEVNMNGHESGAAEEFDGTFSNPFCDRELTFLLPGAKNITDSKNSVSSKVAKVDSSGSDRVNVPIITDEYDFPEDDERMLNRLLFLSDYLNGKYKPLGVSDQEFEDMKWETINETYCLITVDLPRAKAEVIRKYFRRLDTTYVKKDGTYYSVIVKGGIAKEVIDELIEVYPWYEDDKSKVKINWDEFRKSNTNVIKINPSEGSDDHVYMDRLKYAIGNLGKSVEKLNEILSGK